MSSSNDVCIIYLVLSESSDQNGPEGQDGLSYSSFHPQLLLCSPSVDELNGPDGLGSDGDQDCWVDECELPANCLEPGEPC